MSTASKLWLGFGLLLLFLVGIGLLVSNRLASIERALATIMAVQEPATATAYEVALNVSATREAVLAHVDTGEPAHRVRVAAQWANFDQQLGRYNQIARSPESRALGQRIHASHQALRGLADSLMNASDLQRAAVADFERRSESLRALLARERPAADPRSRDAQRRLAEMTRLEADVEGAGAALGLFLSTRRGPVRERVASLDQDFQGAIAGLEALRPDIAGRRTMARAHAEFAGLLEAARRAVERTELLQVERVRFAQDSDLLERLVDDGIHSLARTDLIDAQNMALHSIHFSMVAVLVLLIAGILIGSITALPVGRGIVRTERDLRMRMEELADAHARKDEFLGVLGHELRNPLAPLSNSLHVLEARHHDLPGEVRHAHAMMRRQVDNMKRLVEDLLDVARISQGKITLQRESLRLAALVAQTAEDLRPLAESRRLSLKVVTAGETPWVSADPTRLSQMLTNLIHNAIKYTPEGGNIEITTRADKGECQVRIADTGLGIPAAMLERIFEPFTQVDPSLTRGHGGLGIGLTLVHRLATLHGGSVSAESAGEGRGSAFTLRLPRIDPPRGEAPAAAAAAAAVARRILVVDDNRDAAESLADLLRLWGHRVEIAFDGADGLRRAEGFEPQLVLLDIGLPGMDGYAVADRLRKERDARALTLVALTGFGQEEDRRRAFEAGFDHHLTKPVNPSELRRLIDRSVGWAPR